MTDPATPSERPADGSDPDVEALADLFMDLRLDGPAAEGWTYQQTARHYARVILGRWLGGIRPATPSERPADGSGEPLCDCGYLPPHYARPYSLATPADPERRSVTVETLNRAYRIVERTAHMGGCSQTHHEHLSQDAARVQEALDAAIPQDATPTGLDVERLLPPDDEPYHDRPDADLTVGEINVRAGWGLARQQIAARLAATDPEAEG